MSMEVLGFQHKTLTFQDGRSVTGYFLFLGEERQDVVGQATERVFLSDGKASGYKPQLGDKLRLYYNKFGKIDGVDLL